MQKRSIWQTVFGKINQVAQHFSRFKFISGYSPTFSSFGSNAYASDVVRSTVHAIATSAAKLKAKHIRRVVDGIQLPRSNLEWLLSVRPNPLMSAYDFTYKVVTQLFLKGNAFILIQNDGKGITGFFPIIASTVDSLEYENELYLRFYFSNGRQLIVPYEDIIHLRRYFNESDLFGENNDVPLLPALELINTTNEGIINAIKSSASLRGLLKITQAMLKPEDIKKQRDDFVTDYLNISNNGGIAALDAKSEYTELKNDPKMIDAKQMLLIDSKIYRYFNVNEKFVMSSYSEDEWNSIYESVIEPIALQLSLEITEKVFTAQEQARGNEIVYESNRLQYASAKTKLDLREMVDRGAMTPNEWREVMNLAPKPGGDNLVRRLDTAVVNTEPAKTDPPQKDPEKGEEEDDDDESEDT